MSQKEDGLGGEVGKVVRKGVGVCGVVGGTRAASGRGGGGGVGGAGGGGVGAGGWGVGGGGGGGVGGGRGTRRKLALAGVLPEYL